MSPRPGSVRPVKPVKAELLAWAWLSEGLMCLEMARTKQEAEQNRRADWRGRRAGHYEKAKLVRVKVVEIRPTRPAKRKRRQR